MEANQDVFYQQKLRYIKAQLNELSANIDAYKANTKTMVAFTAAFNTKRKANKLI
jgi:hypothetical protein